jgi:hypothetical protein
MAYLLLLQVLMPTAGYILYHVLAFVLRLILLACARARDRARMRYRRWLIRNILDSPHQGSGSDKKVTPTTFDDVKASTDEQEKTPYIYIPPCRLARTPDS